MWLTPWPATIMYFKALNQKKKMGKKKSVKIDEEMLFKKHFFMYFQNLKKKKLLRVLQCIMRNWIKVMLALNGP